MTNDNSKSGPDTPEQGDSLSATGMFLRAFNAESKPDPAVSDPFASSKPVPSAYPPPQRPAPQPQSGGEFTQLFQKVDARRSAPSVSPSSGESHGRPLTPPVQAPPPQPGGQGADRGPGEFTRVFVGGAAPPASAAPKGNDEYSRSVPLPEGNSSRSKGFSAPGVSGAASGEGSFTQIFKSASSAPTSSPASPLHAPAPPPSPRPSWNDDPIFRSQQSPQAADPSSPSVTTLLNSLGTSGNSLPAGRSPGTAPYRPEPILSASPLGSHESHEAAPGGVTRMIQRLAQMPPEPVLAAPPAAMAPPVSSGPGDFTRMISRMAPSSSAVELPPPAPQAAAPAPAPFAVPALPPLPTIAPPHIPQVPRMAPAAPPAAVHLPAIPKPPALTLPALAAPKTKLEAMVPILLVINTFLLLVLLIVVIFLIKSR